MYIYIILKLSRLRKHSFPKNGLDYKNKKGINMF